MSATADVTRAAPADPTYGTLARRLDDGLPVAAVAVLALATTAGAAGIASGSRPTVLAAAGAAALALLVLMAGEWVDPLVALVVTLPLPALYSNGSIRLAPAAPMTALVVAAWLLGMPGRPGAIRLERLPAAPALLLLAAMGLSGLVSEYRLIAAREILNLALLLVLMAVTADLVARRPSRADRLAAAIAAVAAACGGLAVLETVGVIPGRFPQPGGFNRAALGFGQPNGLGMFLALAIPFVVHVRRIARRPAARLAATAALVATAAGLAGTLSRGSALSVIAGAVLLLLVGRWRAAVRIWLVTLGIAVVADVISGGVIREAILGLPRDWSVAQRAALMLAGVRIFLESPLLGVGPGGFAPELEHIGALVPRLWDLQLTPHNAYIQMAAETGVVGLAAFVGLLIVLVRRGILLVRSAPGEGTGRSLHLAVLWALAIALAEGMVEWPLSHGQGQLVMMAAALACGLPLAGEESAS